MMQNILRNVNEFIKISGLEQNISSIKGKEDKLIIINNSFLFREKIQTNKNSKYLAICPDTYPVTKDSCYVVTGPEINKDFVVYARDDNRIRKLVSLEDSLCEEKSKVGDIVFILMGAIDENAEITAEINHEIIKSIKFCPKTTQPAVISSDQITLQSLDSEEDNWSKIESQLRQQASFNEKAIQDLKDQMNLAFDTLRKEAYLNLLIPNSLEENSKYFLELITESIKPHVVEYEKALASVNTMAADRKTHHNEILRISYNFAEDAITLIRLLISICDLKPVILWNTFACHYKLSESIRVLPWARQKTKASFNSYIDTIKKARNKAFHRLIPFSKAFKVPLPSNSLKEAKLTIFSEHGSKAKTNRLDYQDKELVEVLMEFTRTSEELVSENFWEKNLLVLKNIVNLMESTSNALRLIRQ